MSESQYVTAIIKAINDMGGKAVKFVETEYSEKGTPDIIGCYKGMCIVIEAKVENNITSDIQDQRILEWSKAGAFAVIASYKLHSPKEIAEMVRHIHAVVTSD